MESHAELNIELSDVYVCLWDYEMSAFTTYVTESACIRNDMFGENSHLWARPMSSFLRSCTSL